MDVTIDILTDNYGVETSWTLKNMCSGEEVESGGSYASNTHYVTTHCLPGPARYEFTITDTWGDGICCSYGQGSYEVTVDGVSVKEGGDFASSETTPFGECPTTPTTPPPVTADPTPLPTPNPTVSDPSDCVDIAVDIQLDIHPDQTSWTLANECTGETIVIGPLVKTPQSLFSGTFCLPPAEYQFAISDSIGDGFGSGSYEVKYGGEVVASGGGNFGSSTTHGFGSGSC